MPLEDFIIKTYILVDDFLKTVPTLRKRGPSPQLSDCEVITMEIVGEFLGRGSDKEIYDYFRTHWLPWFPKMGCRTAFTRQLANLWGIKIAFQKETVQRISPDNDLFLFDGIPLPTCNPKRMSLVMQYSPFMVTEKSPPLTKGGHDVKRDKNGSKYSSTHNIGEKDGQRRTTYNNQGTLLDGNPKKGYSQAFRDRCQNRSSSA